MAWSLYSVWEGPGGDCDEVDVEGSASVGMGSRDPVKASELTTADGTCETAPVGVAPLDDEAVAGVEGGINEGRTSDGSGKKRVKPEESDSVVRDLPKDRGVRM